MLRHLLNNSCCVCCDRGFGYIFWPWLVIFVKAKAYRPNPGNIFSIPINTKNKIGDFINSVRSINRVALSLNILQHHVFRVCVEEVDGYTLSNNRSPPPDTTEGLTGTVLMGEHETLGLLQIYRLHILTKSNKISEALPGTCVWVPLYYCLNWVHVLDQYLAFGSNAASQSGHFQ